MSDDYWLLCEMPYPMELCLFACITWHFHSLIVDRLRAIESCVASSFRHCSVFISRVLVRTGNETLYWFVLVRVDLSRRVTIDFTMYGQVPENINQTKIKVFPFQLVNLFVRALVCFVRFFLVFFFFTWVLNNHINSYFCRLFSI